MSKWLLEVGILLRISPTCFLIQALLVNLELADSARIAGRLAPGIHLLSPPPLNAGIIGSTQEWKRADH